MDSSRSAAGVVSSSRVGDDVDTAG